jgi:cytochrome b6-f complex iron-sulfur subunit
MTDRVKDRALLQPCVTRREFLIQGSITSIAIVLAGCAGSSGPTAPGSVSLTVNIADYPSLAQVAGTAYVTSNNNPLVIVRIDDNTFDTFSRTCPHQGGTINTVGNGFECPVHGARFSDTGTWVGGQPTSNLTSYPTQFDSASGVLTIG